MSHDGGQNLDRRALLRGLLATGGLLSVAPHLTATHLIRADEPEQLSPAKFRFGLVTYLWGQDLTLERLIDSCESSGLGAVELRTTHAHGVEPSLDKQQRAEVKARFDDSPVICIGIGGNEKLHHADPTRLKAAMDATRAFLKLSADIGGSGVKVKPDQCPRGQELEPTIERIGKSLQQLGKEAADIGQEIRLEVHGSCAPLPMIERILEIADHPAVGACWNCNDSDLSGDGIEKNFARVSDRFARTLHVRRLDEKRYPYQQLFDMLRAQKWDGWMLLEAHDRPPEARVEALRAQNAYFEALAGIRVPRKSN
ncbi:MAG: TIM barrel protein [Planctomycetota bacterium]|nr:TIM barrel protein [Planctomycetota bacterium]